MNIGIKFKIHNEYGNYLKQILNNLDTTNDIWKIEEDEVLVKDNQNNGYLFPQQKCILDNMEFMEIISCEEYYTIFINIKLYRSEDEVIIENYEDFLKSTCILVLFITDNEFVDIYSKDENMLKIIYKNALENEFSDIKYITENDSKRKKFSAYSD